MLERVLGLEEEQNSKEEIEFLTKAMELPHS